MDTPATTTTTNGDSPPRGQTSGTDTRPLQHTLLIVTFVTVLAVILIAVLMGRLLKKRKNGVVPPKAEPPATGN